ncbi:DNA-3-methyladenine glycosylase family protein [Cellulomonas edaphi]|uniref:DNA-3-methyladenine glycosylase II n=1 Tax=Cellulomonas edaphi TaxID=3053468 RepID=A0ABT7S8H6_9CELL|nr:AlkA N-terminal domain-containing protein [Cellulomons edaphi]MDM7831834.1 AlkA N-terminal domain-containing protein [Cellulomons edaphi]
MDVPFEPGPMLASFVAHAVPGVEVVDREHGSIRRVVRLSSGPVVVEARLADDFVSLRSVHGTASDDELADLATRWFGLADDLDQVSRHFERDPLIGPLVRARPRMRIPGHPDGFEAAVQTVLGQQVSLAAARTFTGRFAAAFGSAGPEGLTMFPTPQQVVGRGAEEVQATVRVTHARARTLVSLARACADGLDLAHDVDHADTRARLLALPGIGPWTVEYLALRVLADRDAFPSADLVLRQAIGVADASAVTAAGRAWAPLRAFAAQHLWVAKAYLVA